MLITNKILILLITILASNYAVHISCSSVWKLPETSFHKATENQNITLNCELDEDADSVLLTNWFRNNKYLRLSGDKFKRISKSSMQITNAAANDSGSYSCLKIYDDHEKIAGISNLIVLVPPKFIELETEPMNRTSYSENEEIFLVCCTNGDAEPAVQFNWTNLSSRKEKLYREYTTIRDNKSCSFLKFNTTREDGDFSCQVFNEASLQPLEKKLSFSVFYKPEATLFLNGKNFNEKSFKAIENTSIVLQCDATASPNNISYEWYYNNELVRNSNGSQFLYLDKVKRNKAGDYSCKCSNIEGESSLSVNLIIDYAQLKPLNKTSNIDFSDFHQASLINITENQTINLKCELESLNRSSHEISWYLYKIDRNLKVLNKTNLSNNVNETELDSTSKVSTYTIENATPIDSGYYTCSINIQLEDSFGNTEWTEQSATYRLNVKYGPVIDVETKQIYASKDDTVELICKVDSNPRSVVSWYLNDTLITNMGRIENSHLDDENQINNSFISKLTVLIESASSNIGEYKCVANNTDDVAVEVIDLKLRDEVEAPIIRMSNISRGSITLNWISPPIGQNLSYILNVNETGHSHYLQINDNTKALKNKSLTLTGLQARHSYKFRLLASNSIDYSQSSNIIEMKTLRSSFYSNSLPKIGYAQSNNNLEALCFTIEKSSVSDTQNLIAKIGVYKSQDDLSQRWSYYFLTKLSDSEVNLKSGEVCVRFSKLARLLNKPLEINFEGASQTYDLRNLDQKNAAFGDRKISGAFSEYISENKFSVLVCYDADSSICTEEIIVDGHLSNLSMYITIISLAICFLVFIFVLGCLRKVIKERKSKKKNLKTAYHSVNTSSI